ncbi:hypothetical protein BDR05DRAFT_890600, partial [Suillus weaverae]
CYPFSNFVFNTLNDVQAVLERMRKFGMKGLMNRASKGSLVQQVFLDEQPLRVFAIAYRYSLYDEVRMAANYTIRQSFFAPYTEVLEHIPASVYHRLLQYNQKCSVATCSLTADLSWFPGFASRWVLFQCDDCVHHPLSWPLSDGKVIWGKSVVHRFYGAGQECADPFLIAECLEAASGRHMCRPAALLDLSVFFGEHFAVENERAIDIVSTLELVLYCVLAVLRWSLIFRSS